MMNVRKKMAGMSLIETILYLGIAVFVLGALFSYGWNVMAIDVKAQVAQEAQAAGQLIGERLRFEIRETENVIAVTSTRLELQKAGETVVIETVNDRLTVQRGLAAAELLHPAEIKVADFIFTRQLSAANEADYVGFSFTAVADYPGSVSRTEYQYSLPFVSGSALRVSR